MAPLPTSAPAQAGLPAAAPTPAHAALWQQIQAEHVVFIHYVLQNASHEFDTSALEEAVAAAIARKAPSDLWTGFCAWRDATFTNQTAAFRALNAVWQRRAAEEALLLSPRDFSQAVVTARPEFQPIRGTGTTIEWVSVDGELLVRKTITVQSIASREVAALNHLSGRRGAEQHVVAYRGHTLRAGGISEVFLEPADCKNARDVVLPNTPVSVRIAMAVAFAESIAFLHANGVIHRDIALRNFLLARERWLVCDFGFARVPGLFSAEREECTDVIRYGGPHDAMAPEAITRGECNTATDVFMLGCTLFHLFWGLPRYAYELRELSEEQRIRTTTEFAKSGALPCGMSQLRTDADPVKRAVALVIDACLDTDPTRRPAAKKVVSMLRCAQANPRLLADLMPAKPESESRKRARLV